jgi:DNA-directed RNA polymerase specialized sigma subunit
MAQPDNWRQRERMAEQEDTFLDALDHLTDELGYPPTREELAQKMEVSIDTAQRVARRLLRDGRIIENGPRTMRIAL